jgi:predicted acetyltransferase
MNEREENSPPRVEVVRATPEQEPLVANLFELYAHDFSEFANLELGEDGRFGYEHLPLYWSEPHRHPFIVRADGRLAGFVFVVKGSRVSGDEGVWDVVEFFIARGYRRRGVGLRAAHEVWRQFPGRWEVRVMEQNRGAESFWRRAVSEFAGRAVQPRQMEMDGGRWLLFSFESGRAD